MKQNGYKIYNMIEISLLVTTCVPFFWDCHKKKRNIQIDVKSCLREKFQVHLEM